MDEDLNKRVAIFGALKLERQNGSVNVHIGLNTTRVKCKFAGHQDVTIIANYYRLNVALNELFAGFDKTFHQITDSFSKDGIEETTGSAQQTKERKLSKVGRSAELSFKPKIKISGGKSKERSKQRKTDYAEKRVKPDLLWELTYHCDRNPIWTVNQNNESPLTLNPNSGYKLTRIKDTSKVDHPDFDLNGSIFVDEGDYELLFEYPDGLIRTNDTFHYEHVNLTQQLLKIAIESEKKLSSELI